MKRIISIVFLLGAIFMCACERVDEQMVAMDNFMDQQNVPGLYRNSKAEYAYNATTDQCFIDPANKTFRIMNEGGDKYLQFTLSQAPVVGESVDVTSKSYGFGLASNTTYKGLVVDKIENNLCYLRSTAEAGYVGIIIAWIE